MERGFEMTSRTRTTGFALVATADALSLRETPPAALLPESFGHRPPANDASVDPSASGRFGARQAMVEISLPSVLTPAELAGLLRLRARSVYQAIGRGDIPGVRRIGRQIRIDRDVVLKWLANGQGRVSRSSRR